MREQANSTGGELMRKVMWTVSLVGLIAAGGCGLDKQEMPGFDGPSTFALSLVVTVSPDVLVADGSSTATVTMTLRDTSARPVVGRDLTVMIENEAGIPAGIGSLSSKTAATGGDGIARVIYTAPARTDSSGDQKIRIAGRVVGTDAAGALYKYALIELRSPVDRLFPPIPGNVSPVCSFLLEPNAPPYYRWQTIPFQSTSSDPDGTIVRYEWDFGDGETYDQPDGTKTYRSAGNYTITHTVIDNGGAGNTCTRAVEVQNR
jgi:hypothetical protein